MCEEQISKHFENDPGIEPAFNPDRQAFTRELVNNAQHPKRFSIMGSIHHEVITPDMVLVLRPQPHAGAVIQP